MPRVFLAGARLSVKRLNTHALHQDTNMLAANSESFQIKLVAHHMCTHEWVLQMQCVNAAHERQIDDADRLGKIIHAAPANANHMDLTAD